MEILREWFFWGESDLFFFGIGIILAAALLPWNKVRKVNFAGIIACAFVYLICEFIVSVWRGSWMVLFICLFAGGTALSIGVGRCLKWAYITLEKRVRG